MVSYAKPHYFQRFQIVVMVGVDFFRCSAHATWFALDSSFFQSSGDSVMCRHVSVWIAPSLPRIYNAKFFSVRKFPALPVVFLYLLSIGIAVLSNKKFAAIFARRIRLIEFVVRLFYFTAFAFFGVHALIVSKRI